MLFTYIKTELKLTFIVFMLVLLSSNAFSQNTGVIAGKVLDKNTQEPLIGATIILVGTQLGAQTDVDGKFTIKNIPTKSYNLLIQYVGYTPKTIYNIVINSGNILNFLYFGFFLNHIKTVNQTKEPIIMPENALERYETLKDASDAF
jgi:hypothetical protein